MSLSFKKLLLIPVLAICALTNVAVAQLLPSTDLIGTTSNYVSGTTNYSFSFTATSNGSSYVGVALRQDPAFWTIRNFSLQLGGAGSNLLQNGNLATGGNVSTGLSSGAPTVSAPTNWGVWYQNGIYPSAAGTWFSGRWRDGSVGSYDGIYQGVSLTAGQSYTFGFSLYGDNPASDPSINVGAYAGVCSNSAASIGNCIVAGGFQAVTTPGDVANSNFDITATDGAPEIDGSLPPKVGFLLGCLFLMFGRKKQNTEPMMVA